MAQDPEDQIPELEAPAPAPPPAPAWEAEVDTFWQNIVLNVSAHVETPIHNFLHDEKEALKARLKLLF